MLNERKIIDLEEKPIDSMTNVEKDEYFLSLFGMTYEEFLEEYKNETADDVMDEIMERLTLNGKMK